MNGENTADQGGLNIYPPAQIRTMESDKNTEWDALVRRWESGHICLPDFQRGMVWTDRKKQQWIDSVFGREIGPGPIGVIVLYFVDGNPQQFVLDGHQRTSTVALACKYPSQFGYTNDDVLAFRSSGKEYPVQVRVYAGHFEAMKAFQSINRGMTLTHEEFYRGVVTLSSGWRGCKEHIDGLRADVSAAELLVVRSRKGRLSKARSGAPIRNIYALLCRWISNNKTTTPYSHANITAIDASTAEPVEESLASILEQTPPARVGALCRSLAQHATSTAREIEEALAFAGVDPRTGITLPSFRCLLDISIWKKNTGVPNDKWTDFLHKWAAVSMGKCTLIGEGMSTTLGFEGISRLSTVCRIIGSDMYLPTKSRRGVGCGALAGLDVCHDGPRGYAEHGDGPTHPGLRGQNRSQGASGK